MHEKLFICQYLQSGPIVQDLFLISTFHEVYRYLHGPKDRLIEDICQSPYLTLIGHGITGTLKKLIQYNCIILGELELIHQSIEKDMMESPIEELL
jgi:hypothetical protein